MAIKGRAQKTLTKIFDGSGVFSIIITNENTSIPISNQGLALNYSATPTDAYVYSGTSILTPVKSNPEAGQYTISVDGENITPGLVSMNGNHASVGNASNMVSGKDSYSINITASGKDFLGNPFTSQKKQVITPLKRGDDATSFWLNVTSSVITKDVKNNMTPSDITVSSVAQSGFSDPREYNAIFKVYYKTSIDFPSTPGYISSRPESSYKITPDPGVNDIRVEMYDEGNVNLLDVQTVPVIAQANGVISTKIVYTVTDTAVQPNDTANWSNTMPTVGKGQYLWTKTTFYYTDGSNAVAYSLGAVGKDGSSAALLTLVSDSQVFTFKSDNVTPSPAGQVINFVANLQNVTGTATFVATPYLGTAAGTPISLGGTGNARTLTVDQFGKNYDSVVVKATLGALSDTETVHKLKDGYDGTDGKNGTNGIQGPKGADGISTYVHIAYANSADGSVDFSTSVFSGKSFIGIYTDKVEADSTDYTKYTWSLVKGADGKNGSDGVQGPKGSDGNTSYVHVAYANSADGNTSFSTTDPSGKAYIGVLTDFVEQDSTDPKKYTWSLAKGADGEDGSDGLPGPKGADGISTYVHFAYATSADGKIGFSTTDTSGKSYVGTLTDTTLADSTDPTKYTWSLIKGTDGTDGKNGTDGAPGPKGADGRTSYVHVAYANSSDGTVGFSTTDSNGKAYIGVYTDFTAADSTSPSVYTWSLVKGQDGQNGTDGAPGPKGADGKTTYIHIAYANSADGKTDFSTTENSGKMYIGALTDYTVADSTDYTKYTWSLFKGADGADGTPGPKGADGRTPYVHFSYANSADGSTDFSTTVYANKKFIGTLTDYTVSDSTDYTKYTWSLIKGADGRDGATGIQGPKGADGSSTYVHFAYANSADGKTSFSVTDTTGRAYVGTLTDTVVADSTDYTKYTWSLIKGADGQNGTDGAPGPKGTDGRTSYVHVAYATSSDGSTGFSTTVATGKTYVGVLTDFTSSDSTNPTDYTWSLIKGADGRDGATGIQGPKGADGISTYVHFAYANSADGSKDFSTTAYAGKLYIGTLTDTVVADSTDYTKYTWSLIKGADGKDGSDGIQGPKGADGISTYVHFAYANSADGSKDFSTTAYAGRSYIGNLTDTVVADSTDYTKYTWSLVKGADGKDSLSGWLTNEAITVQADSNGNVPNFSTAKGTFVVYNGTSPVTGLTITQANATGVTVSISGMDYAVTGMSQDSGYIDLIAKTAGVTITKRLTIAKSKAGATGANGTSVVNSTTPPKNPTEGQWWNDLSVIPNILKVYQKGIWIPYRIDAINLVANSITTDQLASSVLKANNIIYTNSNGTTTNLQTFDFDGIKTLLTDTKGNTYSNMESAVGSTKVMSSLQKQVNDLGQVNQLINTEFSPDFSGWYDRGLHGKDIKFSLGTPVNGSNVLVKIDGSPTRLQSEPIAVTPGMKVSYSVNKLSSITLWSYLNCSDKDGNIINVPNTSSNEIAGASKQNTGFIKIENITIPDGVYYVSLGFLIASTIPNGDLFQQPMLVFSGSVGAYAPGQYNNNVRLLKIEESADKFQISIGESVKDAKSSADSANTKVDNLSTGDRNYILDTAKPKTQTSNGKDNQDIFNQATFYSPIKNWGITNSDYIISFDWTLKTALSSDMQASVFFNQSPWQAQNFTIPAGQLAGHADLKFKLWGSILTATNDVTSLTFRINSQMASGNTITYSNLFMKSGTIITTWTPAPEDIQSGITSAQNSADSAKTKIDNLSIGGRNYLISGTSILGWLGDNSVISHNGAQGVVYDYIPTIAKDVWSYSVWSDKQYTVTSDGKYLRYALYDSNKQQIMRKAVGLNMSTDTVKGQIVVDNNSSVAYIRVSIDWVANGNGHAKLEKGNIATDWSPAPEDVETGISSAQGSADSAKNKIDSLSVGGRNLLIGTSVSHMGVGNNSTNSNFNAQGAVWKLAGGKKVSDLYNQYGSSGYLTISFDWVASGSTISGTFNPQWNNTPWGGLAKSSISPSSSNLSGHFESSVALSTGGYSTGDATGIMFRQDNLQGNITISNLKLESGNQATDWTPAPEDVYSQVLSTNLVVNSEFDNSTGSYTGWHLENPWGTTVTTQISKNGNKSTAESGAFLYPNTSQMMVHDYSSSNSWIYSDPIPIGANQPLSGSITNANPSGAATNVGLALYITAYDSSHNKISNPYSTNLMQVHGNWVVNSFNNCLTPANTAYVSLSLGWNNGKGYFGQPMLQANTDYTGYVPGTPNSNMAIANAQTSANSAQSTANSAQTSADTANQNLANASKSGIRYIRLRSDGNTDNASTHFSEIKVFNSVGTNVVKGKPALLVNGATNTQSANNATDENYNTYIDLGDMRNSEKYVMFDMEALRYDVNSVQISTWTSTRTYYGVVAQTSSDGVSWSTIYRGNITPNQLIGGVPSTVISFGMDTSTVLKLTADNYTLGIDANGNLISGITGNTQQVTLRGNAITLDGNTNVTGDFYAKGGNFTNINIANVSGDNPSLIKSNFDSAYGNVSITPMNITLQSYTGTTLMTELAIGNLGITIKMPGISSFLDSTIINANGMSFQHSGGSYAAVGVMDAGFTLEHNQLGGAPMSIRIGDGGTPNGGKNSANDMAFAISAAQDNGTAPQLIWAGSRVGKVSSRYRTWNNPAGFILTDNIKFSTWDDSASRVEFDDTINYYNYAPVQVYGQRFTDGTTRTLHLSGKEVSSGAKWFGFLDGGDQAGFGTDNTSDVIFFMKGRTYSLYTMLGKLGMR